jgi:hypothetical protein
MTENQESASINYPTLKQWRDRLSSLQKTLIQETWQQYLKTGKWALLRGMYRQYEKPVVVRELSSMPGFLWEEDDHQSGNRLSLFLPGVLLTEDGAKCLDLIERYFSFQYSLFKTESEIREIKSEEIETKLGLAKEDTKLLGHLLILGQCSIGRAHDLSTWSVRTMLEAEDFSPNGDLSAEVEKWILKVFYPASPVFVEDRRKKQLENPIVLSSAYWPANSSRPESESTRPIDGNPFQRRYQVFVSSTFNDLIEERKHVMQALLETKCIPAGMELFPAASMEQMKLIQGVIDDCDYYLVIVAGKYGSCGAAGLSYTEMEFDYAVSIKKPILAFYYSDIKKLAGEKLEETDEARKKLVAFTQKIKHQRMCRDWNTPDGLASAIKTAIIHSIETNPKPGWVRADSVPTWNVVKTLEERIAELEGRPGPRQAEDFPAGSDKIEIPVTIRWEEAENPKSWYGRSNSMPRTFSLNWDELFLRVAPDPGPGTSRVGLLKRFANSLAKESGREIRHQTKKHVIRITGAVNGELFDKILDTFLAQKLLKQISPPKRVRTKVPYWQISPKGVHKLATLRAIRAK